MRFDSSVRRRAFTLIELLVVIAIIAILAAILFPVFAKARNRAKLTTCLSNMKQVGMQFLMYAEDNEERLPYAQDPSDSNVFGRLPLVWNVMRPYGGTLEHWRCPADRGHYAPWAITVDDQGRTRTPKAYEPWYRLHGGGSYFYQTRLGVQTGIRAKGGYRWSGIISSLPGKVPATKVVMAYEQGLWHAGRPIKSSADHQKYGVPLSVMLDGHVERFGSYSKWRAEYYETATQLCGPYP